MSQALVLQPIDSPTAWRGDQIGEKADWIYQLSSAEIAELERVGSQFLDDDPDLRFVTAGRYPLPVTAAGLRQWASDMDRGRGFVLVRGLRASHYSDALCAAIFFVMGLHLGEPMRLNELGDVMDHVIATSDKPMSDPTARSSRVRDRLKYHSDSSDVVALMCLRGAKQGGASSLMSGTTLFNEILRRRPDLAPLMFEPWHYDWRKQDPNAPALYYSSPMCSYVDEVFSFYAILSGSATFDTGAI
jgi:hypothetical protein